jgi:heme a synthase
MSDLAEATVGDVADPVKLSRATAAGPAIKSWLFWLSVFVFIMILVGGATRLTKSGLSITEWDPIFGAIPPLNSADWAALFQKYQQSSQYKLQNVGMTLNEFEFIFWWEWAHRQLGRFIGLFTLLPFLYFAVRGKLTSRIWPRLLLLVILVGLQGALGWYMVASGLVNRVEVSQYRLAAHLILACVFFAAIIWTNSAIKWSHRLSINFDAWTAVVLVGLIFLQIATGGFVAGLNAGQGYNTWPLMDGKVIPDGLSAMQPLWKNLFENALTVQFVHRLLAYTILIVAIIHAFRTFSLTSIVLAYFVFVQAALGIMTLLMHVPLGFALTHQATAMIVLAVAVWNLHKKTIDQAIA